MRKRLSCAIPAFMRLIEEQSFLVLDVILRIKVDCDIVVNHNNTMQYLSNAALFMMYFAIDFWAVT